MHEAMLELYRTKEFGDISVKELTSKAHVARTTFYHYYDNLNDLLEEIEDDLLVTIYIRRGKFFDLPFTSLDSMEFLEEYFEEVFPDKEAFHIFMIDHINGRFLKKWKWIINDSMERRFKRIGRNAEKEPFHLEVAGNLVFNAVMMYLEHPTEECVQYLKEYIYFNMQYLGLSSS